MWIMKLILFTWTNRYMCNKVYFLKFILPMKINLRCYKQSCTYCIMSIMWNPFYTMVYLQVLVQQVTFPLTWYKTMMMKMGERLSFLSISQELLPMMSVPQSCLYISTLYIVISKLKMIATDLIFSCLLSLEWHYFCDPLWLCTHDVDYWWFITPFRTNLLTDDRSISFNLGPFRSGQ